MTTRTPSMVSDVSAMEVAKHHLAPARRRRRHGAILRGLVEAAVAAARCRWRDRRSARPAALATRRISPWPGRNTSSDPVSARSAVATASATWLSMRWRGSRRHGASRPERRGPRWPRPARLPPRPSSVATRAPSRVADMTSRRKSSRRPACASSARARPRSASSERSWNSSNRMAAMPGKSGIVEDHAGEDALGDDLDAGRRPDLRAEPHAQARPFAPTASPSVSAMRAAAPRAASRRGSSTMSLRPATHGSSSSASGTRVVLPAPGGATTTALGASRSAPARAGSTASMGNGSAKARMGW